MLRCVITFLLPALLFASPSPARAQLGPPPPRPGWRGGDRIPEGTYVNTSNNGRCEVSREGRDYVFVNENGTPARFTFVGPGQLRMVDGDWNPNTVATVVRGRDGRPVLRFKEPGNPPGFWVPE